MIASEDRIASDYPSVSASILRTLAVSYGRETVVFHVCFLLFWTPSWSRLVLFLELLGLGTTRDTGVYRFTCEIPTHPRPEQNVWTR